MHGGGEKAILGLNVNNGFHWMAGFLDVFLHNLKMFFMFSTSCYYYSQEKIFKNF